LSSWFDRTYDYFYPEPSPSPHDAYLMGCRDLEGSATPPVYLRQYPSPPVLAPPPPSALQFNPCTHTMISTYNPQDQTVHTQVVRMYATQIVYGSPATTIPSAQNGLLYPPSPKPNLKRKSYK